MLVNNPETFLENFIKDQYIYQSVQTIDRTMLASEYYKKLFTQKSKLQFIDNTYDNVCATYYKLFDKYTKEDFYRKLDLILDGNEGKLLLPNYEKRSKLIDKYLGNSDGLADKRVREFIDTSFLK